jgi:hypothetical protein
MTTGSRKQLTSLRTSKRDEEVLELSYEETRRSPVQIGAAPPKPPSKTRQWLCALEFWTEVLGIFVIRTRRIPFFTNRPGKWLMLLTISCVAFSTILPFTVLGSYMDFAPLPVETRALFC